MPKLINHFNLNLIQLQELTEIEAFKNIITINNNKIESSNYATFWGLTLKLLIWKTTTPQLNKINSTYYIILSDEVYFETNDTAAINKFITEYAVFQYSQFSDKKLHNLTRKYQVLCTKLDIFLLIILLMISLAIGYYLGKKQRNNTITETNNICLAN